MHHFAYDQDGTLSCERVRLSDIADAVGTPCFVYSQATIERHIRVFDEAFRDHRHLVCYAVKANSNRAVLALIAKLGAGADIVSQGELVRAVRAGIPPERIVFSGVGKTPGEMRAAIESGILAFNVESGEELLVLESVAKQMDRRAPVSLRVNPNIDAKTHPYIATGLAESKFGIPMRFVEDIADRIKTSAHLELVGIDCHIGSQLVSLDPLLDALDSVLTLVDGLRSRGHDNIGHIDLGGGLGIPYKGETPPHPSEFGRRVLERMAGRPERIILEPGRVIVGNAGLLLTRVLYKKQGEAKRFLVVDAAMNDLLRPSLYQAHHEIWPVTSKPDRPNAVFDVVGPICESGDRFAKDREIQDVEASELLAVMSAGAYGFSMASTYNSRPLVAEVLVHGDRFSVVRRRQTVEEMIEAESVPDWIGGRSS